MTNWMHDDTCDRCRRGRARARRRDWSWTLPYFVIVAVIATIAALNGLLGYGPHP